MNPEEEKEKALWREKKHLEIKAELEQNEKLKKFLEGAYPTSRDSFISSYAREKVNWIEWGPNHIKWLEKEGLKWVEDARQRLGEIQQKKLFDIQCQWRAEKIALPRVNVTFDFKYWEYNIFNCPFVPPVTAEEVDLYLQYLQSSNFQFSQGFLEQWQDYTEIKAAYEDEDANRNFPDWYDFHNGRTGLSVYMMLPDVRGQKEEFYLSLWRKEKHKEHEEIRKKQEEEKKKREEENKKLEAAGLPPLPVDPDKRPFLNYHKNGWLTWFVNTFEDKKTQEVFSRYGGERAFDEYDDYLEDDLHTLCLAEQPVPIEGWFDWKEAIHRTAEKYRIKKIIEAMPLAFEQYRMNIDAGIPFPESPNPVYTLNDWFHKAILRGRELNGEPQDFNF